MQSPTVGCVPYAGLRTSPGTSSSQRELFWGQQRARASKARVLVASRFTGSQGAQRARCKVLRVAPRQSEASGCNLCARVVRVAAIARGTGGGEGWRVVEAGRR